MSTKIELGSPTDHTKREMFLRHWWSLAGHFVCEDLNLDIVCKTVSLDDFNYNHYSYEFYGENNNNKYVKILEIF